MKIVIINLTLAILEEIKLTPLKKHVFKRPGNFVRYIVHPDPGRDSRYNYEATKDDLKFIEEYKDSPFTIEEFEKIINFFEAENIDSEETVKSFNFMLIRTNEPIIKNKSEIAEKTYEYWRQLRTNRGGKKGLLKKYWMPPDPLNTDPKVTFRRCTEEKRNLRRNRKYDEDYLKKVIKL